MVVLRVDSTILYDRLKARYAFLHFLFYKGSLANLWPRSNYPENKLQENMDSEIMQVLLDEARESYDEEIIVELRSDSSEEIESNIERIEAWYKQWIENNKEQ